MWKFPTKKPWFRWMGVSRRSCVNAWRTRPGKPGPFPLSALGATWRWPGVMGKEGHGTSIPINLGNFDFFFFKKKFIFLRFVRGFHGDFAWDQMIHIYIYTYIWYITIWWWLKSLQTGGQACFSLTIIELFRGHLYHQFKFLGSRWISCYKWWHIW